MRHQRISGGESDAIKLSLQEKQITMSQLWDVALPSAVLTPVRRWVKEGFRALLGLCWQ